MHIKKHISNRKRSVRDITVLKPLSMEEEVNEKILHHRKKRLKMSRRKAPILKKIYIWISKYKRPVSKWYLVFLSAVVISFVSLLLIPQSTKIILTLASIDEKYENAVFNASLHQGNISASNSPLSYKVFNFKLQESQEIKVLGHHLLQKKASGTITIFNTFSTKKAHLIKNTRFKATNGNIYRIKNEVWVPGKKGGSPGAIDVKVFAEDIGESYNQKKGTLKIPGLQPYKDMYTGIYAEIKASIQGGSNGEKARVDESERNILTEVLKERIQQDAAEKIASMITENQIFFKEGLNISFFDISEDNLGDTLRVTQYASIRAVIFDKENFAQALLVGVDGIPSDGTPVLQQIDDLTFTFNQNDLRKETTKNIRFVLNGRAVVYFRPDIKSVKEDIAGQKRSLSDALFAKYTAIEKATVISRPLWSRYFPLNIDEITVTITN